MGRQGPSGQVNGEADLRQRRARRRAAGRRRRPHRTSRRRRTCPSCGRPPTSRWPRPSRPAELPALRHRPRQDPFIFDNRRKPMAKTPAHGPSVSARAMSLAINRPAIAERVMDGGCRSRRPALMPPERAGRHPDRKADPYDPARPKTARRRRFYPDGFKITIHGPNNRYINDEKVTQGVAQMLTASASRPTSSPCFGPVLLRGYGAGIHTSAGRLNSRTGEPSDPLRALVSTITRKPRRRHQPRPLLQPCARPMIAVSLKGAEPRGVGASSRRARTAIAMNDLAIIPALLPGQRLGHSAQGPRLRGAGRRCTRRSRTSGSKK